jgi:hypothetical protein
MLMESLARLYLDSGDRRRSFPEPGHILPALRGQERFAAGNDS